MTEMVVPLLKVIVIPACGIANQACENKETK